MMTVNINAQSRWSFVNGEWALSNDGVFAPTSQRVEDDGQGMQAYRYAFCTEPGLRDFHARFDIQVHGHSDAGLIFSAASSQQFYVLHFPNCGQANRSGQFWAALSRMEPTGLLKIIKLELVNRVAGHPYDVWHEIDLRVEGDQVNVLIDGRGTFSAQLGDKPKPGHVGLTVFNKARVRNLEVQGEQQSTQSVQFNQLSRRPNWFHPCPCESVWQQPCNLIRDGNGDLLLLFGVQKKDGKTIWLTRSHDQGQTWTPPQLIDEVAEDEYWFMHRFPNGTLSLIILPKEGPALVMRSSHDDGRTWSDRAECEGFGSRPQALRNWQLSLQPMLNLRDGSVLAMFYGAMVDGDCPSDVSVWGSYHWHAYTCRSADNGRTWSSGVSLDGGDADHNGTCGAIHTDFTEVSAVEVEDSTILALIRPAYSPWMWETWSHDGGRTWGRCMRGPFPGYACSNMLRTSSGAILIAHRLPNLTVHCSRDGGMSWDQGTMIDSGLWAMGSMIEVEPDLVLYIYWDSFQGLMRAQYLRVTESGLQPQVIDGSARAIDTVMKVEL